MSLYASADGVNLMAEQGHGGTIYQLKKNEAVIAQERKGLWLYVALKETPKIQGWTRVLFLSPQRQEEGRKENRLTGLARLTRGTEPLSPGPSPFTKRDLKAVEFFGNYKCSLSVDEFLSSGEIGRVRQGVAVAK